MKQSDYTFTDKMMELHLEIPHPNNKGKVFILLEGESDVKLYRKFCKSGACKLEAIPGGKLKLEEGLEELSKICNLIIGIRDADFLHLENKTSRLPNLFLTDVHDSEMMQLSVNEVFSAIIIEFCEDDKSTHSTLKMQLLHSLKFIAYFRWYNDQNDLRFNFDNVQFGDIYDYAHLKLDEIAFTDKAVSYSPNAKQKDKALILSELQKLENTNHNILHLCNGHDFTKLLAIYITHKLRVKGEKGVNHDRIASQVRTSYSLEHFKTTKLYQDTNNWALANHCVIYE